MGPSWASPLGPWLDPTPRPGNPPSGQPPPRHPGPGRPRMPLPLGRFPWPRGRAQPGPRGCFRGSTIYCPETRLELIDSVPFINPNWCAKLKRLSRQGSCGFFFDAVFFEASFILRPPAVGRSKSTLLCETYECTRANPASVVSGYPRSNETGSIYFARLQREKVAACLLLVAILRCQLNSPLNGEYEGFS